METVAPYIALFILTLLIVFQLALILKAPIGRFAWGGNHAVLPNKLRVASGFSIALYLFFATFLVSKAGMLPIITSSWFLNIGMWVISIYFVVGVFINAISRSKGERYVMTPTAAILAVTFLFVTLS